MASGVTVLRELMEEVLSTRDARKFDSRRTVGEENMADLWKRVEYGYYRAQLARLEKEEFGDR